MAVRKLLHNSGYRYRLHGKNLPGSPDIVFSRRKKVIFVHGCFWHGHNCKKGRLPKSHEDYWSKKIVANKLRDQMAVRRLEEMGWKVETVWQCELRTPEFVLERLKNFLELDRPVSTNEFQ